MYFCYRKPSLRPWDMDQNFQKCVSDTSTGQKQHLFMHTSCKNQVLVPSGTPQQMLKSGPYQKIPRFIRKFKEILDLWEMNQKCKNCIPNTTVKVEFFNGANSLRSPRSAKIRPAKIWPREGLASRHYGLVVF